MTGRRELLIVFGGTLLAWEVGVRAQAPERVRRIGMLSAFSPSAAARWHEEFRLGLRDLGWVEGKNISIEYRYAEGNRDRLPDLAADLVRLKVEVIVASSATDTQAAQKATGTIPIVMASPGDPVAAGLIQSLARPGGNITGLAQMSPELAGKRLELLKEMIPRLSRVAVLWNPQGIGSPQAWKGLQAPARQLRIELHSLEVRSPKDFDKAFEDATRARSRALVITGDPLFTSNQKRLADLTAKSRLPSMYQWSEFADAGGLVTYGVDRADLFRRAAIYVDKIFKGAKPGDLPIDRATKFELVINMRTAKTLGLTIPQPFLMRADRVIE